MNATVTVTEWRCDHPHCPTTARVESVGSAPTPLPDGWVRKPAAHPNEHRLLDLCPAHR